MWSTSCDIGYVISAQLINILKQYFNWAAPFIIIGLLNITFAIVMAVYLKFCHVQSKEQISNIPIENVKLNEMASENKSFTEILLNKDVLYLELVFFGIKMVNYGLLFWMPY